MHATAVAPAPSEAAAGQIHPGPADHTNIAPLCGQILLFFQIDARPRPPAEDHECGDKVNHFGAVLSCADETLTFKALENSKRGKCDLVSTEQLFDRPYISVGPASGDLKF